MCWSLHWQLVVYTRNVPDTKGHSHALEPPLVADIVPACKRVAFVEK